MVDRSNDEHDLRREALSALADGEASPDEIDRVCGAWRQDGEVRARWHTYHLIGDALRSDELAGRPVRDEAFLQALRGRLAEQPVVLAPSAQPAARSGRRWARWAAPAAAAAGFAAVAGVLVVARVGSVPGDAPVLAVNGAASAATRVAAPVVITANGPLIRDARLDMYLSAHRGAADRAALVVPGAVVRSVDTIVLEPTK